MHAARGRLIIMGDADDTYDFGELERFVERFETGAELIMGTRLAPGTILPGANPWLNRSVGTPALTFALNRLFGTRIRDVNCGLRAIARDAFAELDLRSEGMEFASEMLIQAAVMNLRIDEVPVTLRPDRRGRAPHLRRWRDGWRHLEFMLLHAPDQLLFVPGAILLLAGLILAIPVSLGPARVLGRTFDFHFLFLGASLVLIGLQGVLGAVLVRDVAERRFHVREYDRSEFAALLRRKFASVEMFGQNPRSTLFAKVLHTLGRSPGNLAVRCAQVLKLARMPFDSFAAHAVVPAEPATAYEYLVAVSSRPSWSSDQCSRGCQSSCRRTTASATSAPRWKACAASDSTVSRSWQWTTDPRMGRETSCRSTRDCCRSPPCCESESVAGPVTAISD
jgi:hypothetical protein